MRRKIIIEVKELIEFINPKEVLGSLDMFVQRVDPIDLAKSESLTFCVGELRDSDASIIICSNGAPKPNQTLLLVDNPRLWFIRCMKHFFYPEDDKTKIHPTASINWPFVSVGQRVRIGPGARIGFDGFGYEKNEDGGWEHFPHRGRVIIGDDVDIGANTCIDRGTLGNTVIGDGTKIDNLVHVAHNVEIGRNCMIIALTCIGGGVIIGDDSYVGIGSSIRDQVKVGEKTFIGMGAVVIKDVEDNVTVVGNPARKFER